MPVQPPYVIDPSTGQPAAGPFAQPVAPPTPVTPATAAATPADEPPPADAPQDVKDAFRARQDAKGAVTSAEQRYQAARQAFDQVQSATPPPAEAPTVTTERIRAAATAFDNAQRDLANANTALANAETRLATAHQSALAHARTPEQNAYYQAHADQATAGAELARTQAQLLGAKTGAEVQQALSAANEANARAQSLGILTPAQAAQASADANLKTTSATQISTLLPQLLRQETAKADVAAAGAALAPQTAQATYDKARADADKARIDVQNAQAQLDATTDADRRRAIQLDLNQKQATLDQANQALEQARQLMPLAVEQAGANVASTQAGTMATLAAVGQKTLGPLYGIGDQISKLRDMIAQGQLSPQDADTTLNTYLNQQVSGATPYQWAQEQDRVAQERLNVAQQYAQGTFGQIAQMAQSAGPGFGNVAAQAYADTLAQGRQFFGSMGGFGPSQNPLQQNQAPVVHINIGSGAPTSAPQPSAPAPTLPAAPPALPSGPQAPPLPSPSTTPITQQDFAAASINAPERGPNFPAAPAPEEQPPAEEQPPPEEEQPQPMQWGGLVTRPTVALIGERGPEMVVPLSNPGGLGSRFFAGLPSVMPPVAQAGARGPLSPLDAHFARWSDEIKQGLVAGPGARR